MNISQTTEVSFLILQGFLIPTYFLGARRGRIGYSASKNLYKSSLSLSPSVSATIITHNLTHRVISPRYEIDYIYPSLWVLSKNLVSIAIAFAVSASSTHGQSTSR